MHKSNLKVVLTLKAQFENIFNDIFWDFLNIHLNIIVLRKLFFFIKTYWKDFKNILRIKQWSKGACVALNSVVGPLTNINSYMNYTNKQP